MALPPTYTLDQMIRDVPRNRPDLALIMTRFRDSIFLNSLTFENLPGQASKSWTETTALPVTAKRQLNADFPDGSGGRNELRHSAMKIYGGRIREDRAASKMGLTNPTDRNMEQAKSTRLTLEFDAIFGDSEADPASINGLQFLAENSGDAALTSISAGSTANGEPLSLLALRNAMDECIGIRALVMSQVMQNLLTGASENTGVTGFIQRQDPQFGTERFTFDNKPMITLEKDINNEKLLDFTEAADSGNDTATSIYFIGEGYQWFQNGPPELDQLATTATQSPRELVWILGNRSSRYSVVRLKHIANATVVR